MENNIKNQTESLHIEFYGIPGCGKSTISHKLADVLNEKGYNVIERSYEIDHNYSSVHRKIRKTIISIKYALLNVLQTKKVINLIKKNKYTSISEIIRQCINILPKLDAYSSRKKAIYIWDEGLVQSAISLSFNTDDDNVCGTELLLMPKSITTIKVFINVEKSVALERMNNRKTNDSRIEKCNDNQTMMKMLDKFYDMCQSIEYDCCITNETIDNAVLIALNYVELFLR